MTRKRSSAEKLEKAMEVLNDTYGVPEPAGRDDPVHSIILTILSQNTNDRNRDVAAKRLFERFDSPEDILEADIKDIEEAVRPAGLGPTKARRIKSLLERIREEKGEITLDHVNKMGNEEAKKYLKSFDGIGPKTAAVTLLFVFDKPVMPVDTHVHRVSKRIGLIDRNTNRKKAHDILENMVPDDRIYEFHINLIRHGRKTCTARNPDCENCPLRDICDYYMRENDGEV